MTETEIAGLIMATILAAIFLVGIAIDAWERWQSQQRWRRIQRYLDNRRDQRRWWETGG